MQRLLKLIMDGRLIRREKRQNVGCLQPNFLDRPKSFHRESGMLFKYKLCILSPKLESLPQLHVEKVFKTCATKMNDKKVQP